MSIYNKLNQIQTRLNAPKNQYNSFGKYKYRSCEDILEGLKPLLKEQGVSLIISDDIMLVGDRYYVKATATLFDGENIVSTSAMARESKEKKGMDSAQVTGSTSSYARKYALNGLFAIDDSKDSDTGNHPDKKKSVKEPNFALIEKLYEVGKISKGKTQAQVDAWIKNSKKKLITELTDLEIQQAIDFIDK